MPEGKLTQEVLRSQAYVVAQSKRGANEMSTRQSNVSALKAAGLLDSCSTSNSNDGALGKCIYRFGERDIGLHIDEQLGP
jgi:hypothetical protein